MKTHNVGWVLALALGACSGKVADTTAADSGLDGGDLVDTAPVPPVTKLDLLFMIQNSDAMGDEQAYLGQAAADLVGRLLNPNCVDASNNVVGVSAGGVCAQGSLEFQPVTDIHIGAVTSSLGSRGADICPPAGMPAAPYANLSDHTDDQGHLIARALTLTPDGGTETVIADAVDSVPEQPGYLYWFPQATQPGPGAPIASATQLTQDFQELVTGAGHFGCGIDSTLESWYRFLVQPDPYQSIIVDSDNHAEWSGVDTTILQQRHDFLRPDSAVAVVVLAMDEDREIDVRDLGGTAHFFLSSTFNPPHGTSECAINPADANCTSCDLVPSPPDPNCTAPDNTYTATNDWGYDLHLRAIHMKQKYGVDAQFPLGRYVNAFTSTMVPDRLGEYPAGATSYVGMNDCTNPLFAAQLPDGSATDPATLCNLPRGSRTPDQVFYLHIGGVPHQLLHFTPGDPQASALTSDDWVKILGNDPLNYDYTGIDPHMIESYQPRPGLPDPTSANDADPISGREWITDTGAGHVIAVDLEYACIFPLSAPRDCTQAYNAEACACPSAATLIGGQIPPVCDPNNQTQQVAAKAFPTIRELEVAKLLGKQGIVSSVCPVHTVDMMAGANPLYGYRPAMTALVDRLGAVLLH